MDLTGRMAVNSSGYYSNWTTITGQFYVNEPATYEITGDVIYKTGTINEYATTTITFTGADGRKKAIVSFST